MDGPLPTHTQPADAAADNDNLSHVVDWQEFRHRFRAGDDLLQAKDLFQAVGPVVDRQGYQAVDLQRVEDILVGRGFRKVPAAEDSTGAAEPQRSRPPPQPPQGTYVNPLLAAAAALNSSVEDLAASSPERLASRLRAARLIAVGLELPRKDALSEAARRPTAGDEFATIPLVWLRATVACSLMDEAGYRAIGDFGRWHVWDIGAGSGYHAGVLARLGAAVYASDRPENPFPLRYHPVDARPDGARVEGIAAAGGVALYVWPQQKYPELDRWLAAGGRRVAVVGVFDKPDHFWLHEHPGRPAKEAPRICLPFPPRQHAGRFRLVGANVPPHLSATDASVQDVLQLWELADDAR